MVQNLHHSKCSAELHLEFWLMNLDSEVWKTHAHTTLWPYRWKLLEINVSGWLHLSSRLLLEGNYTGQPCKLQSFNSLAGKGLKKKKNFFYRTSKILFDASQKFLFMVMNVQCRLKLKLNWPPVTDSTLSTSFRERPRQVSDFSVNYGSFWFSIKSVKSIHFHWFQAPNWL